jgi:hypothetical protein
MHTLWHLGSSIALHTVVQCNRTHFKGSFLYPVELRYDTSRLLFPHLETEEDMVWSTVIEPPSQDLRLTVTGNVTVNESTEISMIKAGNTPRQPNASISTIV